MLNQSPFGQTGENSPGRESERQMLAACGPAPVTRKPGSESGACFASPHSPWSPPLAPPAPQRIAPLCSHMSAERGLNGPLHILDKQRRRCVTRNEPWTSRSAPIAANELDALSPRRSDLPVFLSRPCSHAGRVRERPEWKPLPMVSRSHRRGSSRQERRGKAPQSRSQMVP